MASSEIGGHESIKIALADVITMLMSVNVEERKLAEQQLEALQVTEGKIRMTDMRIRLKNLLSKGET